MDATTLHDQLQDARRARESKEHERALLIYDQLLEATDPQPRTSDSKEIRLTALQERSRLFELMGQRDAALAGFEKYYLEAGTTEHAVIALVHIGELQADMGRQREGLATYNEALQLAEAFNYTYGRARALLGSGLTLHRMGRSEEGLSNLRKAQAVFEQIGDRQGKTRALNRLGIVHVQLGQIDRAIAAFQESLALARTLGDRETAIDLNNLGECHQQLYNIEQALEYHQEALALAESTQFHPVLADLSRNLGFDLVSLGHVAEGVPYLQRALAISQETKDRDVYCQSLYTLALAEIERRNAHAARGYAEQLREVAEARNYRGYLADALHALGLIDRLQGDPTRAEQRWQEAIFLAHETGRQFLLWRIHAALAENASNPGLERVHYQIAADIINQIAYPIEDKAIRASFLNAAPVRAILEKVAE